MRLVFGGGGSDDKRKPPPLDPTRSDYDCTANGCPNMGGIGGRYGVDRSGVCYWHYREDSAHWHEVTRRILADDSMRDPIYPEPSIVVDKRRDEKGWAWSLKRREQSGEVLTQAQRQMWREVISNAGHQTVVAAPWSDGETADQAKARLALPRADFPTPERPAP